MQSFADSGFLSLDGKGASSYRSFVSSEPADVIAALVELARGEVDGADVIGRDRSELGAAVRAANAVASGQEVTDPAPNDPFAHIVWLHAQAQRSFARLDMEALSRWYVASARSRADHEYAHVCQAIIEGLHHILAGDGQATVLARCKGALESARRNAYGHVVLELSCVVARLEEQVGDVDSGLLRIRRAVRAARTEGMLWHQVFAGIVLARYRRLTQRPFVANLILRVVAKSAPADWRSQIEWEQALAGDSEVMTAPARHLRQGLAEALRGQRDAFLRGLTDAKKSVSARIVQTDVETLRDAVLGASVGQSGGWERGADVPVPGGLRSLVTDPEYPEVFAWIGIGPDTRAHRVLAPGHRADPRPTFVGSGARGGRIALTWAVLAWSERAEGLTKPAFFQSVYGFEYHERLHDGLFRQMLYRARNVLKEVATIEDDGERYRLVCRQHIWLQDPTSFISDEEQVVRCLARNPASVRTLAASLGMPPRTLHRLLHVLVEEGICRKQRQGRAVVYEIEDTTFQESTAMRQSAAADDG